MNRLWWAQIAAIIRIEWKKTFFAARGFWIYLLALAPVSLFALHTFFSLHFRSPNRHWDSLEQMSLVFAGVFQFFFLRLAIFFGCLGIFMNLFRGEMLDKSLHFYLLAPVRREVLLVGKYLAGLLAASVVFTASVILQMVAIGAQFDGATLAHFLYDNHGFAQIASYIAATLLACLGYGGVFLAAGLLFRNPIFPAAFVLVWEAANPILPSLLKKFSVIYYLRSLCPVDVPVPPGAPALFTLLVSNAEPIAAWLAVSGLMALSVVILIASMRQVRHLEINYASE